MNKTLPRGYRNFNPGNVDRGTDRWLGMAEDQSGDSRFIIFTAPEYGIRCIMRLLITYYERHGLDTVSKVLNRWAPPQGKDPSTGVSYVQSTEGYIRHVSTLTGWHPDEPLDLFDPMTNLAFTKAIIRHELGDPKRHGMPDEWYEPAVYDKATALAGFEVPQKPLTQSRTIAGSVIAAGGAAAGAIYDTLGDTVGAATEATTRMSFLPENFTNWIFLAIVLMGTGAAVYARIDDRNRRVT